MTPDIAGVRPLSGSVAGRRIVVTGVSSGIGAAVARLLAHEEAAVVGVDVVAPGSDLTLDAFHRCDLRDPAQIDAVVAAFDGPLDGLCHAAGLPTTRPPIDIMAVNLFGLRQLTDLLVPRLADGASIVSISSCAGTGWADRLDLIRELLDTADTASGLARFATLDLGPVEAYFLSKEAVTVHAMTLATRHVERGLRVNAVSPGAVYTPILDDFYASMDASRLAELRALAGGREGYPDEIAAAVVFLLSRAASWVNGVNLIVDGGAETAVTLGVLPPRRAVD